MRNEAEMMRLIFQVAKKIEVKAIAMSGSRVNSRAPKDDFQDYDIVYVVEDKEKLLKNREWLADFGEILIMQTPEEMTLFPLSLGECFTFLMLFEDGNRIDLTLCPLSGVEEWIANEPMIQVLDDPDGLLHEVQALSNQVYLTQKASQETFNDCCTEFCWVSTYVVKGLCRREIIYAVDHLYQICQKELLRLYSWQVVAQKGEQEMGKNYKYLFNYLSDKALEFQQLLCFSSIETVWKSLIDTMELFHQEAQTFAKQTGFSYDQKMAEKVIAYAKSQKTIYN